MVLTGVHDLADCITCHAFNKDRTMVALCPNSANVLVYQVKESGPWELKYTLKEHTQVVTGVDWAAETNRIVTCSQDRNAFVWNFENNEWKPTLVILRLNRACTNVTWSPKEDKFAVASGAKCVSVCYFEKDNDWWVSKIIKKHKSTVLSVAWHPDNVLIATGSSDFKCRVFSGFIKGVDKKGEHSTIFGAKLPAAGSKDDLLCEMECRGWVHAVSWSPNGKTLAFAGHDSSVTFASFPESLNPGDKPPMQTLKLTNLPFRASTFIADDKLICAGHDCNPMLFALSGSEWALKGKCDEEKKEEKKAGGAFGAARSMFQAQTRTGTSGPTKSTEQKTQHQNAINYLRNLGGEKFVTSGMDGKFVFWDMKSLRFD